MADFTCPVCKTAYNRVLTPAAVKLGVPVGLWHPPADDPAYTGGVINSGISGLTGVLDKYRARKAVAWMSLSRTKSKDAAGELSVPAVTAYLATLPDLSSYFADGTIGGVVVCDDILGKDIWGPGAPYYDRIDEIARLVTEKWKAVPWVRAKPTQLAAYKWKHLRGAWAQYSNIPRDGAPADYLAKEKASAVAQGLCLIMGLNCINGGKQTPEQIAAKQRVPMTGAELQEYGSLFLPHTVALLAWQWEAPYVADPAVKAAWAMLKAQGATLPSRTCR
jgi:sarcosine oxidase delta subunit